MDPNTAPDCAFDFERLHSGETLRVVRLANELALCANGEPPSPRLHDVGAFRRVLDIAVPEHARVLTPLVLASALASARFAGLEAYVEADRTLLGPRLEPGAPLLAYRALTTTYFALESAGFIADVFTLAFSATVQAPHAPWSLHLWGNLSSLAASVLAEAYRDKSLSARPPSAHTFLRCTLAGFSGDGEHFARSLHTLAASFHGVAHFALDASCLPAPLVLSDAAMRALPTAVHELELKNVACSKPAALALIARCDPRLTLMRLRLRALSNVATGGPVLDDECGRALYETLVRVERSKELRDLDCEPHCISDETYALIEAELRKQRTARARARGQRESMFEYHLS